MITDRFPNARRWGTAIGLALLLCQNLPAAFIVEVAPSGRGFANFTGSISYSSAKGTALGLTQTQSVFGGGASDTYTFNYTPGTDVDNFTPTIGADLGNSNLATGAAGGISGNYNVYVTWPNSANISASGTDIKAFSDATTIEWPTVVQNNVAPANTDFPGVNKWWCVATNVPLTAGTLYTVVSTPNSPGAFVSQRFAGVMWERTPAVADPCTTVPLINLTNGPYAAGTNVVITGVSGSAAKITIYQNTGGGMTPIGSKTSGIVAGTNTVTTTTPLAKGAILSATQTVGGQESCVPSTGPLVGGGSNPRARFSISIREDDQLVGPIGANGGGRVGTRIFYMGCTNVTTGQTLGTPGVVLQPSTSWQTISFTPNVDDEIGWSPSANLAGPIVGTFGTFESLDIAMDDLTDTGPYELYIDNMMNGTNVIQDWEGAAPGTAAWGINLPGLSGTTLDRLLVPSPNDAVVTTATADTGAQSLRVRLQFNNTNATMWCRLTTSGAGGTPNPEVDLTLPVSIRVLLLPLGASPVTRPTLGHSLTGSSLTLTWPGTFNLQYKTNLNDASWSNTGFTTSPYTTNVSSGAKFYRLQGL